MSRRKAKETLSIEDYRHLMEGVYTTSVNESTLDEAPMAYKWQHGTALPTIDNMVVLAAVFGVKVDDILVIAGDNVVASA